jgi:hypothetical protein
LLQQCTTDFVWSERDTAPPTGIIIAWVHRIAENIGPELVRFNAWPMALARSFEEAIDNGNDRIRIGPVELKLNSLSNGQNPIFDM